MTGIRFLISIILILTMAMVGFAHGHYKDTSNVKIKMISLWSDDGGVLIQTNPRHSIEGLDCIDDYWLMLDKAEPG